MRSPLAYNFYTIYGRLQSTSRKWHPQSGVAHSTQALSSSSESAWWQRAALTSRRPTTPGASILVERGQVTEARQSLIRARGKEANVEAKPAELVKCSKMTRAAAGANREPLVTIFERQNRPHLVMAIGIHFFQQVIAINVVAFYAPVLFQSIGFGKDLALVATIILGLVNLGSILVSTFLVDRFGRRFLFMLGGIQMFELSITKIFSIEVAVVVVPRVTEGDFRTKHITKGYNILVIVQMCIYSVGFGLSRGRLNWLLPSEIFPTKIGPASQSISVAVNFGTSFVLFQTFLTMLCIGALFTSCLRVSELLMLYPPIIHVSLPSWNAFSFRLRQRGGGGQLQRLSDA
ncbi:Sugar/inositol transporter [Parasponia andersonii]|uniref:Sugar/inositol transporter n=1 Tax=Parasponia andersonii TaxID=3476 RepID=A0A2P5CKK5_PARAD|nr:Sugar/inositol transporter [Parasponia andersonii]